LSYVNRSGIINTVQVNLEEVMDQFMPYIAGAILVIGLIGGYLIIRNI